MMDVTTRLENVGRSPWPLTRLADVPVQSTLIEKSESSSHVDINHLSERRNRQAARSEA
jgi:hypothetical protein